MAINFIETFPKVVIADLDLTLSNSLRACILRAQAVGATYLHREILPETVVAYWGKPFPEYIEGIYGVPYKSIVEQHLQTARKFPVTLFDGVRNALDRLHDILPVGMLTSCNNEILNRDFPDLGLTREEFVWVHTTEADTHSKPDPRVFDRAIAWGLERGIMPADMLYVGDDSIDFEAAHGAGLEFLGVETGINSKARFAAVGAQSVPSFVEVVNLLCN